MTRGAGGFFGKVVTPTTASASGIWKMPEVELYRRQGVWPQAAAAAGGGASGTASTKLLLHFDSTGDPWLDSSPSARTITAGSIYYPSLDAMTYQKFGAGSAEFSDNTGSYLDAASSADFDWSTGDGVVECWIRVTDLGNARVITSLGSLSFGVTSAGLLEIGGLQSSASVITTNTWKHVAAVKSGGDTYLYADGTRVASGNASWPSASSAVRIGADSSGNNKFVGHIDEFRITRGSDLGYTGSTITVPTAAFANSP
jgi:hypothetical protein